MAAQPWWRIRVTATVQGNYCSVGELQFHSAVAGAQVATGGTAIESSHFSSYAVANVYDGNFATRWESGGGAIASGTAEWIGYHFASAVDIAEVTIRAADTSADGSALNQQPRDFTVQSSPDGVTWTDVYAVTAEYAWQTYELRTYINPAFANDRPLNVSAFTVGAALSRAGWTVSALNSAGGAVGNAVDANNTTRWATGGVVSPNNDYFKIDQGSAQAFGRVTINDSSFTGDIPATGNVQTSPDNATWTTIATWSSANAVGGVLDIDFLSVTARYVRLLATATPVVGSNWWSIGEINLYPVTVVAPVTDGLYQYLRFPANAQLVIGTQGLVELLVVGGGGGGGDGQNRTGGGAGAGGVLQYASIPFPAGQYAVVIGAGGVGGVGGGAPPAANGVASSVRGKVALGGAHGSGFTSGAAPAGGGSGGGGDAGGNNGSAGAAREGFAGGGQGYNSGSGTGVFTGSGGGGANEIGVTGISSTAGRGGNGQTFTIEGSSKTYGGGGGGSSGNYGGQTVPGGTGGTGGGGAGGSGLGARADGVAGTANTGGGGGAGGYATSIGGAGGSGLVVARWLSAVVVRQLAASMPLGLRVAATLVNYATRGLAAILPLGMRMSATITHPAQMSASNRVPLGINSTTAVVERAAATMPIRLGVTATMLAKNNITASMSLGLGLNAAVSHVREMSATMRLPLGGTFTFHFTGPTFPRSRSDRQLGTRTGRTLVTEPGAAPTTRGGRGLGTPTPPRVT